MLANTACTPDEVMHVANNLFCTQNNMRKHLELQILCVQIKIPYQYSNKRIR